MREQRETRAGMRVGIDAQLSVGTATGIGEYVRGLVSALSVYAHVDDPAGAFVLPDDSRRDDSIKYCAAKTATAAIVPLYDARADPWRFDRRVIWDQYLLPLAVRRRRIDVLHCAAGTLPLLARLPRRVGRWDRSRVPLVATVHDVAWLRTQRHARPYARAYFGALQRVLYGAAHTIFVDSRFSRDELLASIRLDPKNVEVVYPGVARDVIDVVRRPDPEPFALVVGTVEVRKNLEVVVRALARVPSLRIVSVGPFTAYAERLEQIAHAAGVADRLDLRGYVARGELLDLYARAAFAAVPSRYEGFGYAAAQALCAGVPLLAADAASLPEIVGTAAPLLDPDDVVAWSEAARSLLADRSSAEKKADALRAASRERFSWSTGARATFAAYARAAGG